MDACLETDMTWSDVRPLSVFPSSRLTSLVRLGRNHYLLKYLAMPDGYRT